MSRDIHYVSEINQRIIRDLPATVSSVELRYAKQIHDIADRINEEFQDHSLILLAGPSASGKTTTAGMLSKQLRLRGRDSITVSLDDFYKKRGDYPMRPDGLPDYESVYSLDLPFMTESLTALIQTGKADLPKYDFSVGERSPERRSVSLGKRDVAIVEGIHALNPLISDYLPKEYVLKLYVNVSSRVFSEEKASFSLFRRDIRLIRRLCRDNRFRGTSPERTFEMWHAVVEGEFKYLFPYENTADIKIDSFHLYEPAVFRDEAIFMLAKIDESSRYYEYTRRLMDSLNDFTTVEREEVPCYSLLREFLGNDVDFPDQTML